jgi:hypothetical protein
VAPVRTILPVSILRHPGGHVEQAATLLAGPLLSRLAPFTSAGSRAIDTIAAPDPARGDGERRAASSAGSLFVRRARRVPTAARAVLPVPSPDNGKGNVKTPAAMLAGAFNPGSISTHPEPPFRCATPHGVLSTGAALSCPNYSMGTA